MKIVFRADSSLAIGSGHIMRCLSLAKALLARGSDIVFICRELPGHCISLIIKSGFQVISLPYNDCNAKENKKLSGYQKWLAVTLETEVLQMKAALQELHSVIDYLIVDHYALDQQWEKQFKSMANHLVVIDDLANRLHNCDLLLDQNLYHNLYSRYKGLLPKNCIQLFGPQYVLLRDEFSQLRPAVKIRTHLHKVIIFFGGVDRTNETKKALLACVKISNIQQIDVVVGTSNLYQDEIKALSDQYSHIHYRCNIDNMAELMMAADLAIGAGGSTSWERCCMGLPTVAIPIAENQIELVNVLDSEGLVKKMDSLEEETLSAYLKFLNNNLSVLEVMSRKCFEMVDGMGTKRVVDALASLNSRLPNVLS